MPISFIVEILDGMASCDFNSNDWMSTHGLFSYCLDKVLRYLNEAKSSDKERLATIEFTLMHIFEFDKEYVNLSNRINNSPKYFVEMLKLLGRNEDTNDINREISTRIFNILDNHKIIPGANKNGQIDAKYLKKWTFESRKLYNECGRAYYGDYFIGHFFSHWPCDQSDRSWPHDLVGEIMEEFSSKAMQEGFSIGVSNKRGIVFEAIYKGGRQERELAKQYINWGQKIRNRWPVLSRCLLELGEIYQSDAQRLDREAELDEFNND